MRLTDELFDERLKSIRSAGRWILDHKNEMVKACIESGLTEGGAILDIGLMHKQMLNLELDRDRIVGKEIGEDTKLAAIIPFDIPNFMVPFYCGTAYCCGKEVVMRFGEGCKPIAALWKQAFAETKTPAISINEDLGGPQFGMWAIEDPSVRHFILAGGTKILKAYSKPDVVEKLDSIVMSGPTRPKAIIDKTARPILGTAVQTIVNSAFYGSGQLCALEKEVVPEAEIYDDAKKLLIDAVGNVSHGTPRDLVGPLGDKWVIIGLANMYDKLKNDPKYEILVGGGYDRDTGVFEPTLVEALEGIDGNIHYFGPLLFLNGAARQDKTPIEVLKEDTIHGGYAYAWTQDVARGLEYEAELKQHYGIVRINTTIFASFFDWPFGGFKKSFVAKRRELDDTIADYTGLVHHATMLTGRNVIP